MKKIAVLDQNTIDKIAAGEVVERPSSVVKELVENAIDAGATAITVEITDGGKKLIRITDNGSGMDAEQVPLAFLRHATSKIEKVEDLTHIASLGFRGEALSSIAAVSQVELITKTPSGISGTRYVIEGGKEQSLEEMGAPEGTTFLIRNLFYNTPARSKFLKSDMTEAGYINTLMEQLALSHPEISFKYIQNRQVKLSSSGNYSVKDVIYSVYGREIAKALLDVSYENDFMKIEGFVGKPEISRGNRTFENYYINGRYVKNKIITKAIEDGYKGLVMQHKFPFVSLRIEMDGNDLDVNVHPAKREVRFARETEVYTAIYETVRKVLTHRELIPQVSVGKDEPTSRTEQIKPGNIPEPFEVKRRQEMYGHPNRTANIASHAAPTASEVHSTAPVPSIPYNKPTNGTASYGSAETAHNSSASSADKYKRVDSLRENPVYGSQPFTKEEEEMFSGTLKDGRNENSVAETADYEVISEKPAESAPPEVDNEPIKSQEQEPPKQLELFEERLLAPESRSRHRLIGQLFDTYWLVQFEDNFYIIDQHAAHEKVYYERFVKQFQSQNIQSQYVSPPLIVSLSLEEENLLKANKKYFRDFGFEIEPFGGREYSISAVPSSLLGMTEEELFLEMLDHLTADGSKDAFEIFASRLATMACKAAVKGNHSMSPQEADKLIDELLTLENPYNCPHGRPTIIAMSKTEIEKKFKRIV
ncbi:DNA mismatch repair endonuclease MutL [Blautia massiliensis (ex Durand et al. 2017)]|uniref:DNA mismatch repair endonuclease MutL n=1 Tax=Blautia massiliensis (ex Durand et al. 2017) TaxID=1737424 RepID=UPI00242E4320|nr:DNA mismatch repair endonuclease MutL [Blautia massiliensis (ex Durand et al. 2017)]